jgi:hypothetical protein
LARDSAGAEDEESGEEVKRNGVYSGWWRCRIKGRTHVYPWHYLKVEAASQREWRRKARLTAAVFLNRMDFEIASINFPPENRQKVGTANGVDIFAETTFAIGGAA